MSSILQTFKDFFHSDCEAAAAYREKKPGVYLIDYADDDLYNTDLNNVPLIISMVRWMAVDESTNRGIMGVYSLPAYVSLFRISRKRRNISQERTLVIAKSYAHRLEALGLIVALYNWEGNPVFIKQTLKQKVNSGAQTQTQDQQIQVSSEG